MNQGDDVQNYREIFETAEISTTTEKTVSAARVMHVLRALALLMPGQAEDADKKHALKVLMGADDVSEIDQKTKDILGSAWAELSDNDSTLTAGVYEVISNILQYDDVGLSYHFNEEAYNRYIAKIKVPARARGYDVFVEAPFLPRLVPLEPN